jgi:hypothetical protein
MLNSNYHVHPLGYFCSQNDLVAIQIYELFYQPAFIMLIA